MPLELHVLRPYVLALLPVAWLFCWFVYRNAKTPSGWQSLIARHLQPSLLSEPQSTRVHQSLLPLLLTIGILAAAGPALIKQPQPAFTLKKATVLVMDMSLSMRATDLKPNRVSQARFKALDFAQSLKEGELGLISFAGDAFVISPLTPDHHNITLLLPDLKPEIMPVQGSDLASALELANKLLTQAGYPTGDVVVFTDGFASRDYPQLRNQLDNYRHRVSFLSFGSSEGAPVQLESGELLKDNRGAIVIPKVPIAQLQQLAAITQGVFVQHTFDNSDIQQLLQLAPLQLANEASDSGKLSGDQWQDAGVYLVWLLLPLALFAYKRAMIPLAFVGLLMPGVSRAVELEDFYKTPTQQAKSAYQQGDYAKAQAKFSDPLWQGNAAYRDGRFAEAEALYRQQAGAEAAFNLGNSLAQQQKFDAAIDAYQQALAKQPDLIGAKENIKLLEEMKKQQAGQSGEQQDQSGDQSGEKSNNSSEQSQKESTDESKQQQGDAQNQSGQQPQNNSADPANEQASGDQAASEQNSEQNAEQSSERAPAEQPAAEEQPVDKDSGSKDQGKQQQVNEAWPNATPEQNQQLESLMRKVQDDPSILLRNKMYLEYQKRQQQGTPRGVNEQW